MIAVASLTVDGIAATFMILVVVFSMLGSYSVQQRGAAPGFQLGRWAGSGRDSEDHARHPVRGVEDVSVAFLYVTDVGAATAPTTTSEG